LGDKTAIIFEADKGEVTRVTYGICSPASPKFRQPR